MNFRDQIKQTIQDAPARAAKEEQERKARAVNAFCKSVKYSIIDRAQNHTDPSAPFKANMLLICSHPFAVEEGQRRNTLFQTFTKIDKVTLLKETIEFEEEIRAALKKDGITVGKWRLYNANCLGEPALVRHELCYPTQYGLYWEEKAKLELYQIDPYKPFSIKDVEDRSWGRPHHTYTYIQDSVKIPNPQNVMLVLRITINV